MSAKKERPLNVRQEMFAQAYAASPTAGQGSASARAAGYSLKSANAMARECLRNPRILRRIEEIKKRADKMAKDTFDFDREDLIRELLDALAHAKGM